MWHSKLSFVAFLICFFCLSPVFASQVGLQYVSENTYRNNLGPLFFFMPVNNPKMKLDLGAGFLFSDKDWESLTYRAQLELPLFSLLTVGFRSAHRLQIPETFARTTFLGFIQMDSPRLGPISFHVLGGWYRRFSFLQRASVFPFVGTLDFSQHDFSVEAGLSTQLAQDIQWKLKVATFDELEVYNLNHPFVESALSVTDSETQTTWEVLFRYHISLGFGRLDRLALGFSYSTPQSLF